jgi:hypothetical protein
MTPNLREPQPAPSQQPTSRSRPPLAGTPLTTANLTHDPFSPTPPPHLGVHAGRHLVQAARLCPRARGPIRICPLQRDARGGQRGGGASDDVGACFVGLKTCHIYLKTVGTYLANTCPLNEYQTSKP